MDPSLGLPQPPAYATLKEGLPLLCQVSADLTELIQIFISHRESKHANAKFAEALLDKPQQLPRTPADLARADPKLQQRLSHLHHEMTSSALLEHLSPSATAMRLSLKSRGASAPLDAIPSCQDLLLSTGVFRDFLYSYQLIPIFEFESRARDRNAAPQTCSCHSVRGSNVQPTILTLPGHIYGCTASTGMTLRHDCVANEIADCLRSASVLITSKLQHNRGSGIMAPRPDLEGTDWPSRGDEALLEVTVTNPLKPSVLSQSSQTPLSAATTAERLKLAKYSDLAWKEGKHLYLIALEASGAFGVGLQKILRFAAAKADKAAFDATAESRTWAAHHWAQYWTQRIACAFWRGSSIMFKKNATAVRERMSHAQMAQEGGEEEDAPSANYTPRSASTHYQAPPTFPQEAQYHQGPLRQPAPPHHPGFPQPATTFPQGAQNHQGPSRQPASPHHPGSPQPAAPSSSATLGGAKLSQKSE